MVTIDYTEYTDEDLSAAHAAVEAELTRRQGLDGVYQQIERVLDGATAKGLIAAHEPGADWTQPSHAGDAYRRGDVVAFEGKQWESTVTPNTWQPGVSGWHPVAEPDPETGEPGIPEWVRPSGTHDAYALGDQVLFEGDTYESIHPGANTWAPNEYGWELVEGDDQ